MIASNGVCKHVNGGYPTNCYKSSVSSLSSCEAQCTSGTPCVGFYYKASAPSSLPNCRLITSDSSCPSGFSLSSTTVASSKKDLVRSDLSGWVCYGKDSGKQLALIGNCITIAIFFISCKMRY